MSIPDVDDAKEFNYLMDSMDKMGFKEEESEIFIRLIAAILLLGQIDFVEDSNGDTVFDSPASKDYCQSACKVLGVSFEKFAEALLKPPITAGKDVVVQSVSPSQAKNSLESVSRATYECLFAALVNLINKYMAPKLIAKTSILVLDISGFEIVENNNFEQFSINFTNEKLQQFINHHIFIREQEEYIKEGIEWNMIDFKHDLQPTIDLIEGKDGILRCLDTLSCLQRSTDRNFLDELCNGSAGKHNKFSPSKFGTGFRVMHYAGSVEYKVEGWIEKNRDPVSMVILRCLANSSIRILAEIYSEYSSTKTQLPSYNDPRLSSLVKKGQFHTISQIHREQLNTLLETLLRTNPFFVRCILPNIAKSPNLFSSALVAEQLVCNGVYEGLRSLRCGFPNRIHFINFVRRYGILLGKVNNAGLKDYRNASIKIINHLNLNEDMYRIGISKVLLRAGVIAEIEEKKIAVVSGMVIVVQAYIRGWLARKRYRDMLKLEESATIIQSNVKTFLIAQNDPWWRLYTKLRPLLDIAEEEEENTELMNENERLKTAISKEVSEKEALTKELNEKVNNEKKASERLNALEAELKTKAETILSLSEKVSGLEEKIMTLSDVEVEKNALRAENESIKEDLEETKANIELIEKQKAATEKRISGFEEAHSKLNEELSKTASANKRLTSELESERIALDKATIEISRQENQKSLLEIEKNRLFEDNKLSVEEKNRLHSELSNLSKELYDLKQCKEEVDEKNAEYKNTISELSGKLAAADSSGKDISSKLKTSAKSLENANKEIENYKEQLANYGREKDQLNEKIRSLNAHIELKCSDENKQSALIHMRDAEIAELNDCISKLNSEHIAYKKKSEENSRHLLADIEESKSQAKSYSDMISALENKCAEKDSLMDTITNSKSELEAIVKVLNNKVFKLDSDLASAESREKSSDSRIIELSTMLKEKTTEACNTALALKRFTDKCKLLEEELRKSGAKNVELESGLASTKLQLSSLKDGLENQTRAKDRFESDYKALKEKYRREVTEKVAEAERIAECADEELKKLNDKLEFLTKENESLKAENDDLNGRNMRLVTENEDLKVYINKDEHTIYNLKQQLSDYLEKYVTLNKEYEKEKNKSDSLNNDLKALRRDLDETRATVQQQEALITSHKDEKNQYTQKLDSIISQLTDNDKNIYGLQESNRIMKSNLEERDNKIKRMENMLRSKEEELSSIEREYKSNIEMERQKIANLELDRQALEDAYEKEFVEIQGNCDNLALEVKRLQLSNDIMSKKIEDYTKPKSDASAGASYYSSIKKTYEDRQAELIEKLEKSNSEAIHYKDQINELKKACKKLTSELESASANRAMLEEKSKKMSQDMRILDEKVRKLESDAKVADDNKERFKNVVEGLENELRAAKKSLIELEKNAPSAQDGITNSEKSALEETIAQLRSRETALLLKIRDLNSTNLVMSSERKLLADQYNHLTNKYNNASSELAKERSEVTALKDAIDRESEKYSRLTAELRSANDCIKKNNEIIDSLNEKVKNIKSKEADTESTIKRMNSENSTLKEKIYSLDVIKQNLNNDIGKKQAEIDDLREHLKFMTSCEVERLNKIGSLSEDIVNLKGKHNALVEAHKGEISELNARLTDVTSDAEREKNKLNAALEMQKSTTESYRAQCNKYTTELNNIKAELSSFKDTCASLSAESDKLREVNKKLESKHKDIETYCASVNGCLKKISDKNSNLRSDVLDKEKTIQDLKNRETTLLSQRDEVIAEVARLSEDIGTLDKDKLNLQAERDRATEEVDKLKREAHALTEEIMAKDEQISTLESNVHELNANLKVATVEQIAFKKQITDLNKDIDTIRNKSDKPMKTLIEEMSKTVSKQADEIKTLKSKEFSLENEIRDQKALEIEIRGELDLERRALQEANSTRKLLEEKVADLKNETQGLKNVVLAKELEIKDAVSKLEDLEEKKDIISAGIAF